MKSALSLLISVFIPLTSVLASFTINNQWDPIEPFYRVPFGDVQPVAISNQVVSDQVDYSLSANVTKISSTPYIHFLFYSPDFSQIWLSQTIDLTLGYNYFQFPAPGITLPLGSHVIYEIHTVGADVTFSSFLIGPNDVTVNMDTDGDGVGDNTDAFPNDATEDTDTDGDGVGDNSDEIPSIPTQDVVNLIKTNPSRYNLYSIDDIQDLRAGSIMVEVTGNQATVQLQMEESSDLQTWEDTGTPATMTIPADTDTKFFRFKMAE